MVEDAVGKGPKTTPQSMVEEDVGKGPKTTAQSMVEEAVGATANDELSASDVSSNIFLKHLEPILPDWQFKPVSNGLSKGPSTAPKAESSQIGNSNLSQTDY